MPGLLLAATFAPEKDSALLALAPDYLRTSFSDALLDAGANWSELAEAVTQVKPEYRTEAIWLLLKMPHLDRLEMTRDILLEHIEYAHKSQTAFRYAVSDTLFRDYILAYRIAEEPVTPWRRKLFDQFAPLARDAPFPKQAARSVNEWLARNLRRESKGFFGPMKSPELTLLSHQGTQEEIAVLASAILKSLGIASRRAKVPWLGEQDGDTSWVEVYSDGQWLPFYPLDAQSFGDFHAVERRHPHNLTIVVASTAFSQALVTENYTPAGVVRVHLTAAGQPLEAFEWFSFNTFSLGGWRALDELNTVTDSQGSYRCVLGDGRYLLTGGMRDPNGNPFVVNRFIEVKAGETLALDLDLTPPPTQTPETLAGMSVWNLPNLSGGISSIATLRGKSGLVLFLDAATPDCSLAAVTAEKLYQEYKDKDFAVLGIGVDRPDRLRSLAQRCRATFPIAFVSPDSAPTGFMLPAQRPHVFLVAKNGQPTWDRPVSSSTDLNQLAVQVAKLLSP
jgi:hypothetical protein